MPNGVSEAAQQYYELEQELDERKQEISELRSRVFGADSEEVEEQARSLFESVGNTNGSGKSQKIDDLEQEVEDIEQEIDEMREELRREFTEIRFPFDETIEHREEKDEVGFPFTEPLSEDVIQAIDDDDVIRNDLNGGDVELRTSEIVVHTDDVSEAISAVEDFAKDLREAARHELNTDDYVEKLAGRDLKIQRMLYELYESEEPLAKKELEERSGVEKGGLRGVLYSVYDRDPYLNKENQEYTLSEIGKSVIEKFVEQYEKPEIPTDDEESAEDDESEDEDSQMTLDSTGDSE